MTGRDLEGWIDEPWAKRGASRARFFQNVMIRMCPDLINPLLASAKVKRLNYITFEISQGKDHTKCMDQDDFNYDFSLN